MVRSYGVKHQSVRPSKRNKRGKLASFDIVYAKTSLKATGKGNAFSRPLTWIFTVSSKLAFSSPKKILSTNVPTVSTTSSTRLK